MADDEDGPDETPHDPYDRSGLEEFEDLDAGFEEEPE